MNVPLGQLEAELLAPDITADMYEQSAAQWEEDRHWAQWLQGLMDPENLGRCSLRVFSSLSVLVWPNFLIVLLAVSLGKMHK